jgi:DNA-binding response OmpR family regulator
VGNLCLDDETKTVTVDGETASLTPREYEILKLLMKSPGKVFPPREIYRRVWNEEPYGAESTVAVHIRHLREKLEIDPANPRYIKAVWGQGYKIDTND